MTQVSGDGPRPISTIGHSTRALELFIALLKTHGITKVVDVRSVPRSRHNPQFNLDTLPGALGAAGIGYLHMAGLGGLRHPRKDSQNTGWRNLSFRGFADYMQTPEFSRSLEELIAAARDESIALMCAEAVPWRCHRSLIADALVARGYAVHEIIGPASTKAHRLTPWAKVDGLNISYPLTADASGAAEA